MSPAARTRALGYVLLPLVLVGSGVAFYFSGVPALQGIAAPAANREFGLIENLQNVTLAAASVIAWRAGRREASARARLIWRAVSLGALVVLLEELDYFWHWLSLLQGDPSPGEPVNLHNRGAINDWLKRGTDVVLYLGFGVLPWLVRSPQRAAWLPSRWSLGTLLVGLVLRQVSHGLEDAGVPTNEALTSNISEFRETITYWVVALFVLEMALRRRERVEDAAPTGR